MTVQAIFWPSWPYTLVIPILRPIIPGMVKPILLFFKSICGFCAAKRTAKIGTEAELPRGEFKKCEEMGGFPLPKEHSGRYLLKFNGLHTQICSLSPAAVRGE